MNVDDKIGQVWSRREDRTRTYLILRRTSCDRAAGTTYEALKLDDARVVLYTFLPNHLVTDRWERIS